MAVIESRSEFSSARKNRPCEILPELFDHANLRHLKVGETLLNPYARGEGCYLLDRGLLKLSLESPNGGERIIALLSKGSIVGDLNLGDGAAGAEFVAALLPSELRHVSRACFDQFAERHPEVYRLLASMLAKRLQDSASTIAVLTFLQAKARVAHALLTIAERIGEQTGRDEVVIPEMMAQKELAAMAGVARENVNRFLKTWEQQKLLSRSLRTYRIRDKRKLQDEVGIAS